jgi:murein DD-endopeptidase MepM/ murein hydrolase activator NlpD
MLPYKNLKTTLGNITTKFGGRTRGEAFHPGVDIANAPGTPIPALADGVITTVGKTSNGFGNVVTLKDGQGGVHQYGHLQGANVRPGMKVKRGQQIARMGRSGNSYSPTGGDPTHLDIRIANAYGKWADPTPLLQNINKQQ